MSLPENIDALLVKFDINQEALARVAGVAPSSVTRWRNGAQMRKDSLEKICSYFNLTEDDLLSDGYGLAAKEHGRITDLPADATPVYSSGEATVPLVALGRVHAGALTDEEAAEHRVEVPASVCSRHPRAFALVVEGNCMDRVIPEGAHVLVDPDREPCNGSIAVVETEAYQAVMRRWYRGSSTLMLTADSHEEQEDLVFSMDDGPVRVVGTVVWWQAPREME
ncbi:helix-turn-helix domain-containing protein [Collinsella tanakaei]|nr:helix-turn-helix domain-containing protein [Collinsella tanakaei]